MKKSKKINKNILPNQLNIIPIVNSDRPPIVIEDGEDRPLARIPLSKLMAENGVAVCVLCGNILPVDSKEVSMDGGIYQCCRVCPKKA
jgi:hypothetical protein